MNSTNVFSKLKHLLKPHEQLFVAKSDNEDSYYLEYKRSDAKAKPEMFAAVMIKKNYVSLYYMPVYHNAELLKDISPKLQKRMQGKSCFNFTDENDESIEELKQLIDQTAQLSLPQR